MNTNYALGNCQQNVNFNGRVDKKTAKLAKKMGGEVLENLEGLAGKTGKDTVIKLNEMGGEYGIYAFNRKIGSGLTVGLSPETHLAETLKNIDSRRVEEGIVNASIRNIKNEAAAGPMSTVEKKMLREDARETLKLQRQLGIKEPFWGETKKIMRETEDRASAERLMRDREYQNWKMSLLNARTIK